MSVLAHCKRSELLVVVELVESEKGKPSFVATYAEFIAGAASLMQIVQPFVEGLTGCLGH